MIYNLNKYDLMYGQHSNLPAMTTTGNTRTDYEIYMSDKIEKVFYKIGKLKEYREFCELISKHPELIDSFLKILRGHEMVNEATQALTSPKTDKDTQ